jgi:hypothetical protein
MPNSIEATRIIAGLLGKPAERTALHVTRRLGEADLIVRGPRGKSSYNVNAREIAVIVVGLMALTDADTPAVDVPKLVQRIMQLDAEGQDPAMVLMGDAQTPTLFGSFITKIAQVIEGKDDAVQGVGLEFCRNATRAWIERDGQRVYFGIRDLPSGMIQAARVDASLLGALRKLLVADPSVAAGGSAENATPARKTGPARVGESPHGCSRASLDHDVRRATNMIEHSLDKSENQSDSGADAHPDDVIHIFSGKELLCLKSKLPTPCAA